MSACMFRPAPCARSKKGSPSKPWLSSSTFRSLPSSLVQKKTVGKRKDVIKTQDLRFSAALIANPFLWEKNYCGAKWSVLFRLTKLSVKFSFFAGDVDTRECGFSRDGRLMVQLSKTTITWRMWVWISNAVWINWVGRWCNSGLCSSCWQGQACYFLYWGWKLSGNAW